jgi:hypothetical protein
MTRPHLKELDLTMEWCGCVLTFQDHYAFDFSDGKPLAANLESLTLYGYSFDSDVQPGTYSYGKPWTWKGLKYSLSNARKEARTFLDRVAQKIMGRDIGKHDEPRKTNLEAWMGAMDWSGIRRLSIDSASNRALKTLSANLPNLESFHLGPLQRWGVNATNQADQLMAVMDFLSNVGPLRELSLESIGSVVPVKEILKKHGSTLTSLRLHERESLYEYEQREDRPRDALGAGELRLIRDMCPNLETLDVDVDRNGTWVSF